VAARRGKKRLTRSDWLDAALKTLERSGIGAVTVEGLAATLQVTRGSFYHHFRDRRHLLDEMLQYWAKHWTYDVPPKVRALGLDPQGELLALSRAIREGNAAGHDAAFRAWALHDHQARNVVRQVDEFRLSFIRSLFEAIGFEGSDAENRARLFLYYEMSEPGVFARQSKDLGERLVIERHRFLTAGAPAAQRKTQPAVTT